MPVLVGRAAYSRKLLGQATTASDGWQQFLTSSFSSTPGTLSPGPFHLPAYFHVWLTLLYGCSVISTMPVPAAEVIVTLSASTFWKETSAKKPNHRPRCLLHATLCALCEQCPAPPTHPNMGPASCQARSWDKGRGDTSLRGPTVPAPANPQGGISWSSCVPL